MTGSNTGGNAMFGRALHVVQPIRGSAATR